MSVLLEFSMFPTDKGDSVSEYVSKIIAMIRNTNFDYRLNPMGTVIETNTIEESLAIVNQAYKVLEPYSNRVYSSIKLDIQKNKNNRLVGKVESIEKKIGEVKK